MQQEKYLKQYKDRTLLATAARIPSIDELDIRLVVLLVERVIEKAISRLETLLVDTRYLLREPKLKQTSVQPLTRRQNVRSQQRAIRYQARLIYYYLRLDYAVRNYAAPITDLATDSPSLRSGLQYVVEAFPQHRRQKIYYSKVQEILQDRDRFKDNSEFEVLLDRQVLRLSSKLFVQDLFGDPYQSGLIHFLAVLSIDPSTNRLRLPATFSLVLVALVYICRVLFTKLTLPKRIRVDQGRTEVETFLEKRRSYLIQGSYSPISIIIQQLAYAKRIAFQEPSSIAGTIQQSSD